MPSVSGWALRHAARPATPARTARFYALGIGLGFATIDSLPGQHGPFLFLCPRYRAGLCDINVRVRRVIHKRGFYALGIGLGFATGLRVHLPAAHLPRLVSMPSVSGWALRRTRCGGARDLRLRTRVRQPPARGARGCPDPGSPTPPGFRPASSHAPTSPESGDPALGLYRLM